MKLDNQLLKCDRCGSLIPKDPEDTNFPLMLAVKDEIWEKIGEKGEFICPDCMMKIWGRKFKFEELKVFKDNGRIIPCNLWYIRRNGMVEDSIKYTLSIKKELIKTERGKEYYIRTMKILAGWYFKKE